MSMKVAPSFKRSGTAVAVATVLFGAAGVAQAGFQDRAVPAWDGVADTASTTPGTAVTVDVRANDGSVANAASIALGATSPTKGTVTLNGNSIEYTANAGTTGTDTFTYKLTADASWRGVGSMTALAGVSGGAPVATTYVDGGGTSPITNGTTDSGVWNNSTQPAGVIGRSFTPSSTSTVLEGCYAGDSVVPTLDIEMVWDGKRTNAVSGATGVGGNMLTVSTSTTPSPLVDAAGGTVLRVSPNGTNPQYDVQENGSSVATRNNQGNIGDGSANWWFRATANINGVTATDFATLPVTVMASTTQLGGANNTTDGKTWDSDGVTFQASVDTTNCNPSEQEYTVTVNITSGVTDNIGNPNDLDEDKDGIPDTVEGDVDTDGDGVKDYLDLDSDNDSIADIVEAGGADANADGKVDNPVDANGDGQDDNVKLSTPTDTNADGKPNFQSVDSNGDGTMDIAQTDKAELDGDKNGMIDSVTDTSPADGLHDALAGAASVPTDSDSNGTPDYAEKAATSSGGGGGGSFGGLMALLLSLPALVAIRRRRG